MLPATIMWCFGLFLFRPEPPAEPRTPAHSTAYKTLACFTTIQQKAVGWAGDKKVKKERDRVREQVPQTCLYLLTDATQKSRLPRVTI